MIRNIVANKFNILKDKSSAARFYYLREYTNLTLNVIEFSFHKEFSGEKILEKFPHTMPLTSIGMIINKPEC